MTARAYDTAVDPSGLNGERLHRIDKQAPYVVQLWAYPATISFDTIKAAWLVARPRARYLTGFREEGVRGGKRLVTIDFYQREPEPALHLDEPPV